ncbi:peptide ABC transporter substrate-binding protein [Lichenibacterium dinghuense]|uniref:peptide ABC transporter substrate-binding protein n=1 Tax=Lichenibacterium dinghuense TaxID=2895977 RepID=UPI001F3AA124|nr:peptide ABC transporter substrate-binding protein [Lichenibacterium sp. 6Y81]
MNEQDLRGLVADVRGGRLSRRGFVQRMIALGLTAPMAGAMLGGAGTASAATAGDPYKPTKAGGGGPLKLLFWQGPTVLNAHFSTGTKDAEGSRLFYEPLAAWDDDGNLVPVLATAVPSEENGMLAADGKSVTWKIKPGVTWHDGKPLTADDLVFTWEFIKDPAAACVTIATYRDITVKKVDDLTVEVVFAGPTPFWADAFVGRNGLILPKHVYSDYMGGKSRDAPANLMPIGTGPYRCVEFRPGDTVRGERFEAYHKPNRPYFDTVELKGGGDAVSAARAVLQTGDYDFGWNLQVEDEVLKRLEDGGKGHVNTVFGNYCEFIYLNATDPNKEVDGERSSLKTTHPAFSDPAVRRAMNILVDRKSISDYIYGRTGKPTSNVVNGPARYTSTNTRYAFDVAGANKLLDDAGWAKGSDGIRAKNGYRMHFLFQTSINGPRQKTQAIIKQAAAKAGIEIELKAVPASVFFAGDPGNTDTDAHFYADMEEYANQATTPDAADWMKQYATWEIAQKSNKWSGWNYSRWSNKEFDDLFNGSKVELDPVKRAAMFIKMNDIVVTDNVLPIIQRASVAGLSNRLHATRSGWDNDLWAVSDWWKDA